jgi:hypothetical protein
MRWQPKHKESECSRHGVSRRFCTPPAASAVPLTHRDPRFRPDNALLSPLPVAKSSTSVGDCRNHNRIVHEPIHNTVRVPPQEVLAVPTIAKRPPLGCLDDFCKRSLNGFLRPFCRVFASGTIPIECIFVFLCRARQEPWLIHAFLAFVEHAL